MLNNKSKTIQKATDLQIVNQGLIIGYPCNNSKKILRFIPMAYLEDIQAICYKAVLIPFYTLKQMIWKHIFICPNVTNIFQFEIYAK